MTGLPSGASRRTARRYTPPVAVAVEVFVPPVVLDGLVVTRVLVYSPVTSEAEANRDWLLETFTVLPITSTYWSDVTGLAAPLKTSAQLQVPVVAVMLQPTAEL